MGMMSHVAVFGFGSFFLDKAASNDIDLLLVHEDTSAGSCAFASRCKKSLAQAMKSAHITVLSWNEEQDLNFVEVAKAQPIGTIKDDSFETDIAAISTKLKPVLSQRLIKQC